MKVSSRFLPGVLLLHEPRGAASECRVNWNIVCRGRVATSSVTFSLDEAPGLPPTYAADVVFHWGAAATGAPPPPPSTAYVAGETQEVVRQQRYAQDGEYYAGYAVTFGEGSGRGCEGETFEGYAIVTFGDRSRALDEVPDGAEVPTRASTDPPTNEIISPPTRRPALRPTDRAPSDRPTRVLPVVPPQSTPVVTPSPKLTPELTPDAPYQLDFPPCDYDGRCSPDEHAALCEDCAGLVLDTNSSVAGGEPTAARGIMFSLCPRGRPVVLQSIDIYSAEAGVDRVAIFTRPGGYRGHETVPEEWVSVYNNFQNLLGSDTEATTLKLNNQEGVYVPAGSDAGFFIYTERSLRCRQGTAEGDLVANDTVLELDQGVAVNEKWNASEDGVRLPLSFMGRFRYDVVEAMPTAAPTDKTLVPTLTTTRPATVAPVTASAPGVPSTSPVGMPATSMPVLWEYKARCKMILYHSNLLDDEAQRIWTTVTIDTIQKSMAEQMFDVVDTELIKVDVNSFQQVVLEQIRRRRMQSRRIHHGSSMDAILPRQSRPSRNLEQSSALQIQFISTILIPSVEKNGWDAGELVGLAFASPEQQRFYVSSLQEAAEAEGISYFASLERMNFEADDQESEMGTSPTRKPSDPSSNGNDTNRHSTAGNTNTTMYYIVGAVVAGSCILIFAITTAIFFHTRKRSENKNTKPSSSAKKSKQDLSLFPVKSADCAKGLDGLEVETEKSGTLFTNQPKSYIGTIESKEEVDDVSTLGDPYMGDAVNAVMDTDNTVGESMVSAQQELYVYGVGRTQGASILGGGTIGGSTIGSKHTIFGEDPTLEDMYRSPRHSDLKGEDGSFELKTVVAPAGKLGIVLDNPHGNLPIVWAIKETSVLQESVRVGDLLTSVDGVDTTGMSTHRVSTLLSSRSTNASRTLVFARSPETVNEVQRAALW